MFGYSISITFWGINYFYPFFFKKSYIKIINSRSSSAYNLKLISIFQEDVPPLLEKIESALSTGDHEKAHESAHALKGLVGNYAAAPALTAITALDNAARTNDLETARAHFPQTQAAFEALGDRLAAFVTELDSSNSIR